MEFNILVKGWLILETPKEENIVLFCFFFFFFKEILQSLETPKLIESPKLCSYFRSDVNRQQARFAKLAFREMMRNTYELLLKPKLYQS